MSSKDLALAPPLVGRIGTLPAEPGDVPGLMTRQDEARATALRIHNEKSLPFLEKLIGSRKKSDRIKLDAIKLIQLQALPPPQPVMGDVDITIIVDL